MNNPVLVKLVREIGLSNNQAVVYLALLELGRATVSQIARQAGINRTTGYDVLNHLIKNGLVSISGKKPKQEYAAESPAKIKKVLEEEALQSQERFLKSQELIPQLQSIYNIRSRPRVRFYEGKDGLEEVYEDTLTAREPIRAYANVDDMHKALPDYFPRYYERRAHKGIHIRAIIPANEAGRERVRHDLAESRESALVPADKFHFSPEINIYNNKVMIASLREKLGIIIESQEIADAMKQIFELSWAEAKRLEKELKNSGG